MENIFYLLERTIEQQKLLESEIDKLQEKVKGYSWFDKHFFLNSQCRNLNDSLLGLYNKKGRNLRAYIKSLEILPSPSDTQTFEKVTGVPVKIWYPDRAYRGIFLGTEGDCDNSQWLLENKVLGIVNAQVHITRSGRNYSGLAVVKV